jgi:hypothetical protein
MSERPSEKCSVGENQNRGKPFKLKCSECGHEEPTPALILEAPNVIAEKCYAVTFIIPTPMLHRVPLPHPRVLHA